MASPCQPFDVCLCGLWSAPCSGPCTPMMRRGHGAAAGSSRRWNDPPKFCEGVDLNHHPFSNRFLPTAAPIPHRPIHNTLSRRNTLTPRHWPSPPQGHPYQLEAATTHHDCLLLVIIDSSTGTPTETSSRETTAPSHSPSKWRPPRQTMR